MNNIEVHPDECWTEERLKALFAGSADVNFQTWSYGERHRSELLLIHANGLCRDKDISQVILPELKRSYREEREPAGSWLERLSAVLPVARLKDATADVIAETLFKGDLIILFIDDATIGHINIADMPTRQPCESTTEISVKGPRDGFVEDVIVNIALIRKRLRSPSLHVEDYVVGRRSKTRISLLFFYDIIDPKIVDEARRRLRKIDVDGIISTSQVEELLVDSKFNILPMMEFTGRPDYVVNSLLSGRLIIIVDGMPMVLIAPAGLSLVLKSPEDAHFNYSYIIFARLIRGVSLFLSIFLPAIWVALVTFHQDQIPFRLLATVSVTRLGLPLSSHMEMFLLLTLLEIFREAGVRLPSAIGQTLTSIGGLIIGDAAIRAGLVSPSVVVVGAVTAVSGVTLVNQSLSTQVSILRLFFFLMSALLGLYGVIIGMVMLIAYMGSLRSFGVNYLAPLSPIIYRDLLVSYLRVPWAYIKKRPRGLNNQDADKQGGGA